MYITLVISATDFTFQLREEDGTAIGAAMPYSRDDYRIETMTDGSLYITVQPVAAPDGAFPFTAQFPRGRTVITYTP